jgi:hypothetical protein
MAMNVTKKGFGKYEIEFTGWHSALFFGVILLAAFGAGVLLS